MFGSAGDADSKSTPSRPHPRHNCRRCAEKIPVSRTAGGAGRRGPTVRGAAQKPDAAFANKRSENYYDIKSTIFNALIDAIDLTQLGQLDRDAARDEIRDIVNEIITLKDVVMSIAEQEELLEDICNDVLGFGPLEPLLARDDIADIMVNGCNATFIEVNGKMQKGVRPCLLNICQRIVSQIGRLVD
jgi:pilus assembly protein CpaF